MDESSDHKNGNGGSSGGGGGGSSRWNPTKEQIGMLENLYKQGIRTPSAEQIQHITARLRAYGHIEGKNVFYWFQNHKARQRQKQKQETIAYFNRFLHRHHPIPILSSPSLCPNLLCAPYYLPQCEMGFYPQHPKVLVPESSGIRRMPRNCDSLQVQERMVFPFPDDDRYRSNQETLPLFPLQPTGILEGKTISAHHTSTATDPSASPGHHIDEEDGRLGNQPFFDFLSSSGQDFIPERLIGENTN